MRLPGRISGLVLLVVFLASLAFGGTITGVVKGPDGAPLLGAFVQAQNSKTRITFMGLSDEQGRFRVENVPAGEYRVTIKATGYRAPARSGFAVTEGQDASADFSLQAAPVRWNEISMYQARKLFPDLPGTGKQSLFGRCFICHNFQTRMASVTRDEDGWKDRVAYMRQTMAFNLGDRLNDQNYADVAAYLNSLFGEESVLPKSPTDMPQYKETVRAFSRDAMNIQYVEYDLPGPNRMPFSAYPDKNGKFWIPNFGLANRISRLDPTTGAVEEFRVPFEGTAAVHSAVPAPDGSVWLTEQGSNRLGHWDPATQKITEFQDARIPGKAGLAGGSKHTLRFDGGGNVWSSGDPLSKFDPKTQKFTDLWEVPNTYSVAIDPEGNVWFTAPPTNQIGKVDWKTMKITKWTSPTKDSYPRRIEVDSDGMVWYAEYTGGKIASFDPKTQKFKEYQLPGPAPTPYGFGIDANHNLWYAAFEEDLVGRLDPKTGKVTEYPFPHSENTIREFLRDDQGRMWYGSNANNKVGYYYLGGK